MIRLLYWLIYNFDLGPFGPSLMGLAVKTWLFQRRHRIANDSSLPAFRFWAPDQNLSFER
ncbi:MAG: hypothetical protein WB662_13605 [Methyloceanibacter sp.]|jgi:hypothetical protein